MNRTSENIDKLGCCCVATKNNEGVYTGFAKRLRPKNKQVIDSYYAAAYFNSPVYRNQLENIVPVFTTRASLNDYHLKRMAIYYPDWEMQVKIGKTFYEIERFLACCTNAGFYDLIVEFRKQFINQWICYPILQCQKGQKR